MQLHPFSQPIWRVVYRGGYAVEHVESGRLIERNQYQTDAEHIATQLNLGLSYTPGGHIGPPKCAHDWIESVWLDMYEQYMFWHTLWHEDTSCYPVQHMSYLFFRSSAMLATMAERMEYIAFFKDSYQTVAHA